jgi:hypothetical protein
MGTRAAGPAVRILLAGTVVLALAACGSGSGSGGSGAPGGATGSSSSGPSPSSSTPPPRTPAAAFPLTVSRTGGIAGFHDVVVLGADGHLEVNSRGHTSSCQLRPEVLKDILRAVGGVPWGRLAPADSRPKHPDDMVLLVTSGGRRAPARLDDPLLGGLQQQLSNLVVDSSGPNPAHELCLPA